MLSLARWQWGSSLCQTVSRSCRSASLTCPSQSYLYGTFFFCRFVLRKICDPEYFPTGGAPCGLKRRNTGRFESWGLQNTNVLKRNLSPVVSLAFPSIMPTLAFCFFSPAWFVFYQDRCQRRHGNLVGSYRGQRGFNRERGRRYGCRGWGCRREQGVVVGPAQSVEDRSIRGATGGAVGLRLVNIACRRCVHGCFFVQTFVDDCAFTRSS